MFDKDKIVKGCRCINMYNWYIRYMILSSFLEISAQIYFGKTSKIIWRFIFAFSLLCLSICSVYMRSSSSFDAEIKKLLALQKRDRFPVGPGRAGSQTLIEYHIHSNETSFTSFSRNKYAKHKWDPFSTSTFRLTTWQQDAIGLFIQKLKKNRTLFPFKQRMNFESIKYITYPIHHIGSAPFRKRREPLSYTLRHNYNFLYLVRTTVSPRVQLKPL